MAENILLHTEHLSKKFGEQFILKDISLDVKKSEVVVIIGPSGCGKSTFLRCINGLEPLSGGKVELDGAEYFRRLRLKSRHLPAYRHGLPKL